MSAYQDQGGVWTIGYGHISGVVPGIVITQLQANVLLMQDIAQHEVGVGRYVNVPLTQNQFDGKGAIYYFDGEKVRPLTHPDEMKVLQDIYKENNGQDMPFFNWTSSVPWHYRLKGILERPKEF